MASFEICRYTIVSTGGTATSLENAGVSVTKVEQLTCFPEMVKLFALYKFALILDFLLYL